MTRLAAIARRHRFGQTVLFALTVCLLVGTAAVEPLLSRSLSTAMIRDHAAAQGLAGTDVIITASQGTVEQIMQTERQVDPRLKAVVGTPTETMTTVVRSSTSGVLVQLRTTYNQCQHVRIISGRCPLARNEVIASQSAVTAGGPAMKLGARLPVVGADTGVEKSLNPHKTMRLVGIFAAPAADPFWAGDNVGNYQAPLPPPAGATPSEYWLTSDTTFTGAPPTSPQPSADNTDPSVSWPAIRSSIAYPVLASRLTPGSLPAAATGVAATANKLTGHTVVEPLTAVNDATHTDLHQVSRILPFLLAQLGVVLLILLVQVTSFFATVRRGDAAVLKMRGNGTLGVLSVGAVEFLPAYVIGAVGGVALAYLTDGLARHLWFPGNVAAQWSWTALRLAIPMAAVAALVWILCWWAMARGKIVSLLRARPLRRRGARLSISTAVLATLCLIGIVLTATKNLTGAPVQMTPTLLAGLVAIVAGTVFAPVAAHGVRRQLVGRRAGAALSVAQLGRRAGVVVALTTLIISAALLTFSASIFARSADNRAARAAADVGATAFIFVDAGTGSAGPHAFVKAVDSVDPRHTDFAPVVEVDDPSPEGTNVVGVVPAQLQRIGLRTGLRQQVPWAALGTGGAAATPNVLVSTWTTRAAVGSSVTAPTLADVDGEFQVVGSAPYIPGVGARTIVADLTTMLRRGDRLNNVSYEVLSATDDPKRLAELKLGVQKAGFGGISVHTVADARAAYDATATAWATKLSILVSVLSVLAALVSVVLVAVASQDERRRDLRALATGGVPQPVLRRATVGEFVLLALAGSVIGVLTAPLAFLLAGPSMLWWSTPPAQPVTRTGFQWQTGTLSALGLVVVLALVGAAFGGWLARSAEPARQGQGAAV